MQRSVWSTALWSSLALALALPGCIGQRRPQPREESNAQPAAQGPRGPHGPHGVIQPEDVDGTYDAMVQGERVRARYDARDPAIGSDEPLVTIVEYSDFQCPFCSKLANTLHEVTRDYDGEVKLVFKQLPLPMHANAEPAARAALAAHQQGKFWEMHDELFANQRALDEGQLIGYAQALGLDMKRFREDYGSDAIREHAAADKAMATALEIRSTPTFYVNGVFHKGAQPPESIRAIIDQELLAARKLLDAGVPRHELYARILHAAPPLANEPAPPAAEGEPSDAEADDAPEHQRGEASRIPNYAVPVGEKRPTKGPDDALVTLVQFSAFGCEECSAQARVVERIRQKYPNDVRVVFRHLPDGIPARRASQVAMAAHAQGKFWEMHDALMKLEGDMDPEKAPELAKAVGLDVEKFSADLRDPGETGPMKLIEQDIATADVFRGEAKAPLFFVNGRYLDRNPSFEDFDRLVQEEKAKAEAFMAENRTPKAGLYEAMRRSWRGYDQVQARTQ